MSESTTSYGGPGYLGLLSLIFVAAKVTGHIDWSWWIVFSPVILHFAIVLIIIVIAVIIACDIRDSVMQYI